MTFDDLCTLITCAKCGAGYDELCRTSAGHVANTPHSARCDVVTLIWNEGFTEGQRDVVSVIDSPAPWSTGYIDAIRRANPPT